MPLVPPISTEGNDFSGPPSALRAKRTRSRFRNRLLDGFVFLSKLSREFNGLKAIVHVTGGGIEGNTKRLLPPDRTIRIEWTKLEIPPVFNIIQKLGNIDDNEMRKVFNLGIGEIFIIHPNLYDELKTSMNNINLKPFLIGSVE